MNRAPRILICNWRYIGHPNSGGAEVWTQKVAEGLSERGCIVTVFTSKVEGLPSNDKHNGVQVIRRGNQISLYWHARQFLKAADQFFDFIIDEVNTRPFFAHLVTEVPVIAVFHQTADEIWKYEAPFPLNFVGRFLLERRWIRKFRAHEVIAVSESTASSLRRYGITKIRVIQNGVDQAESKEWTKSVEPSACFLGRLVASKRPEDSIIAFLGLRKKFPNAVLHVIGNGPLMNDLSKKYGGEVRFTGFVSNKEKNDLLRSSHLLLVTSVREGWGLNVTEASTVGTLTIAYDVPGLRDSVRATNGILVEQRPEALREALVQYFSEPNRWSVVPYTRTWDAVCSDFYELITARLA